MPLFSSPMSYLGIDFDQNSVKIVELRNESGRPRLITYGYADREVDKNNSNNNRGDSLDVADLVKEVCRQAKTTTTKAIVTCSATTCHGREPCCFANI